MIGANGRDLVGARSIVILRALQLGDMLCAVPTFRALRDNFPNARICLVGLPWARSFVTRFAHYIDEFICFPGYPGLPEIDPVVRNIPRFIAEIQEREFDLALQLHGSGSYVNSLVSLFGAKKCAGFYTRGHYCPDPRMFLDYPDDGREIDRLLALLEFLDLRTHGADLEFPITEMEEREFKSLARATGLDSAAYVCIHPGSRAEARRWPPSHFAAVADSLAEAGFTVVFTGVAEETCLIEHCVTRMRYDAVNLAGRTPLGVLAALLQNSKMLLANDTGVSHIAAALKVPSIILFSISDPNRWAPWDAKRHRAVNAAKVTRADVVQEALGVLTKGVENAA